MQFNLRNTSFVTRTGVRGLIVAGGGTGRSSVTCHHTHYIGYSHGESCKRFMYLMDIGQA